jgi:hypothetical protein
MNASFQYHYQPLQAGPASPSGVKTPTQRIPEDAFPPPDLDVFHSNVRELKPERKSSMPVVLGSLIGTLIPMALLARHQGQFSKLQGFKKLLVPFYANYKEKPVQLMVLGASATLGGLLGGIYNDKGEDTWAKIKEGNYQFITNIMMPITFCVLFEKLMSGLGEKFPKKLPWLNSEKLIHQIPKVTLTNLLGIVTGVTVGAFLSNQVNKRIHKDEIPPRKIHPKDFVIQVDDMIGGFTATNALENLKSLPAPLNWLSHLDKVLPLVYFLSGMETGNEDGSEKAKEHRPNPA